MLPDGPELLRAQTELLALSLFLEWRGRGGDARRRSSFRAYGRTTSLSGKRWCAAVFQTARRPNEGF